MDVRLGQVTWCRYDSRTDAGVAGGETTILFGCFARLRHNVCFHAAAVNRALPPLLRRTIAINAAGITLLYRELINRFNERN